MNIKHQISALAALGLGAGVLMVTADSAAAQTTRTARARAAIATPKNITIRGNSQRNVTMDVLTGGHRDGVRRLDALFRIA